jgi:oligopeptide transport system substrate-binding protein
MRARVFQVLSILTVWVVLVPSGVIRAGHAARQGDPVTYYMTQLAEIETLDPQRADFTSAVDVVEQLFLGLTNIHPETGEIVPEMAADWTVDDDGRMWTFTLRDDVPWVRWDPASGEAEIVGMVTARDFEYSIRRACDPRLYPYVAGMLGGIIAGCDTLADMPPDRVTAADYEQVDVHALDDFTLQIRLYAPAGYFLALTTLTAFYAVPREVVEGYGDGWTIPGVMVTNGPFMLDEYPQRDRYVLLRNPYLPGALHGPGNVDRVIIDIVENTDTAYRLYQAGQLDVVEVPATEWRFVRDDPTYADQLVARPEPVIFYFGFSYDKVPFDDERVRRAFGASVDRERFIEEVRQGRDRPMIHLTPPGVGGAVPVDEIGIDYDPVYARAQLAAAGYPHCQGFPAITIMTYTGAGDWADFLADSAHEVLGCDPSLFHIKEVAFFELFESIDPQTSTIDRPHIWTFGWGPNFPDAHDWIMPVLYCGADNYFKRPCTQVDDLLEQAAAAVDLPLREALYARATARFFGDSTGRRPIEGEYPLIPLYQRVEHLLRQPWVSGPLATDGMSGGGIHLDWITINPAAQLAARGGP